MPGQQPTEATSLRTRRREERRAQAQRWIDEGAATNWSQLARLMGISRQALSQYKPDLTWPEKAPQAPFNTRVYLGLTAQMAAEVQDIAEGDVQGWVRSWIEIGLQVHRGELSAEDLTGKWRWFDR